MIRDQFKDVKKVTTKEARKKASLGERAYYTKKINRLQDLKTSMGVSLVISTVIMAIAYAVVLFIFCITLGSDVEYELWKFICWSIAFGVFSLGTLVWYLIFKPKVLKNIETCRHELERINAKTLSKAAATYALYGEAYKKKQEQLHREDKEKIEKIAEQVKAESVENGEEKSSKNEDVCEK
jgi:hypothetical protein